jgi:hypothetical protein
MNTFFQPLESRTMLSVSHVGEMHDGGGSNLTEHQKQLKVDVQHLNDDRKLRDTTLAADRKMIEADKKAIDAAKLAAKKKLECDTKKMKAELDLDSKASKKVRDVWMPVLTKDLAMLKGETESSEHYATDKAKFDADLQSFKDAMAPCETETKADIAKWNDVITADKAAIESAGSALVTKFNTDSQKLISDTNHFKEVIGADEATVKADLELIKQDAAKTPKK